MPTTQATSTAKPTPRRTRKPKAAYLQIPYPSAPNATDKLFWLAHYFRDLAHAMALDHKAVKDCAKSDAVTQRAMAAAQGRVKQDSSKSLQFAAGEGLLLFAWPGTSIFKDTPVRH